MRLVFALVSLACVSATFVEAKPNLLVLLADDLGYGDLGCYGAPDIPTPHLDQLARTGARLTSWYAQPYCTPSRFSLLTGRHPNRAPALMNALNRAETADHGKGLNRDHVTLAGLLRPAGYRSTLLGKWHLGHGAPELLPLRHGFDRFFGHTGGCVDMFTLRYGNIPDWYEGEALVDPAGYATDVVTEEVIRVLRQQRAADPFFLYVGFAAPHYGKGWDAGRGVLTNVLQAKPETIARLGAITNRDRRIYAAMVVELDAAIGRILRVLDETGLAENTWVIFASDNGGDVDFGGSNIPLRGEKGTLWEGGIRVPCLMRWPGRIPAGTVIAQPAMVTDLVPTFAALAGVMSGPHPTDGIDLGPALFHGRSLPRDVFHLRGQESTLRRAQWKYRRTGDTEQLYDLNRDPGETNDVAAQQPAILAELRARHAATARTFPLPLAPSAP
jgi:arylsulfatase A-like enzyme